MKQKTIEIIEVIICEILKKQNLCINTIKHMINKL